jgi:hypothetical protein
MSMSPAFAATLYNNLTPNNSMGMASNPGASEIEAADDFILTSDALITGVSFTGLITNSGSISGVVGEIYRVFPFDSTNPPSGNVPTRVNSPSDVALDSRDSAASELTFTTTLLSPGFATLNSVGPGGIHVNTGGSGVVRGDEVQFDVTFNTPISLTAGHYFFVPQVDVSGGQFYWLSGSRPAATPFSPDLQAWIRDSALQPDWLRVGTDIVGGSPAPTFNGAFSVDGTFVPEPSTVMLVLGGAVIAGLRKRLAR